MPRKVRPKTKPVTCQDCHKIFQASIHAYSVKRCPDCRVIENARSKRVPPKENLKPVSRPKLNRINPQNVMKSKVTHRAKCGHISPNHWNCDQCLARKSKVNGIFTHALGVDLGAVWL